MLMLLSILRMMMHKMMLTVDILVVIIALVVF